MTDSTVHQTDRRGRASVDDRGATRSHPAAPPASAAAGSMSRLVLVAVLWITATPGAIGESERIGNDVYSADPRAELLDQAPRDAFLAALSATLSADVAEDAHVAGMSVRIDATVGADLYAAGARVEVHGHVRDDITASGFAMTLSDASSIGGNARLAAGDLEIIAPIDGSLVAAAGTFLLDAAVGGDVRLDAIDIRFGDDARIEGTLDYSAPSPVDVPAHVIAPERIRYRLLPERSAAGEVRDAIEESVSAFWPDVLGRMTIAALVLFALLLVSAIALAFAPRLVDRLQRETGGHAWRALLYGFVGLSVLFGAVPVSALLLVGIPLIPLVLLTLVVFWIVGYLLGVHVVATRIWQAFGGRLESTGTKLGVLALGLTAFALLNFIPLLGWLVNVLLVLLGLGAITFAGLQRLTADRGPDPASAVVGNTIAVD